MMIVSLAVIAVVLSIAVVFVRRNDNTLSTLHYVSVLVNLMILGITVFSPNMARSYVVLLSYLSLILSVMDAVQLGWDWTGGSLVVVMTILTSFLTWKMFSSLSHPSRSRSSPTVFYTPVLTLPSSSSPWQPPVLLPRSRAIDRPVHPLAGSMLPGGSILPGVSVDSTSPQSIFPSVSYPPSLPSLPSLPSVPSSPLRERDDQNHLNHLNPRLAHQLEQMKPIVVDLVSPDQTQKLTRYVMQCFFPDTPELVERWVDRIQTREAFVDLLADLSRTATPAEQATILELLEPEVRRFQTMWSATKTAARLAIKYTLSNGLATPQRRQWGNQQLVSHITPNVFLKMQRYLMEHDR